MLNTWWFNLSAYMVLYIVFTQCFKKATRKSKHDGALTFCVQFFSGLVTLLFIPFFSLEFANNWQAYACLLLACVFYAMADRINTTARKGLDVSTYGIISQVSTVFMVAWGVLFAHEAILPLQILGVILILLGNITVLYERGGKFTWNKYVLCDLLGSLTMSIGISIDVGISEQFNMPIYVAATLILPATILFLAERIKIKDIKSELKHGDKKALGTIFVIWGMMIIFMLRSYQFGGMVAVAPIMATNTILNVFAAYIFLKEKDSLLRKVIAAIIAVAGIILIKI